MQDKFHARFSLCLKQVEIPSLDEENVTHTEIDNCSNLSIKSFENTLGKQIKNFRGGFFSFLFEALLPQIILNLFLHRIVTTFYDKISLTAMLLLKGTNYLT